MSFCGAGGRMCSDAFKTRHVEMYYAQKTTATGCPGSSHPLSPHAKRRRPVKQHLRQLGDITQCKNDHDTGANGAGPLDTLSKFMRSRFTIYFSYKIKMHSSLDDLMGIFEFIEISDCILVSWSNT